MSEQRILVGTTQTLVSYPRLNNGNVVMGQPTSCTVRIGTPAVSMPTSYSNATVDSVSATILATAEAGSTSIELSASLALVAGRLYLVVQDTVGQPPLLVESQHTFTSAICVVTEPIPHPVWEDESFKGIACTYALSTAQTDQPGNGLALWRAVIAGVTYEWAQSFRVVRRIPVCPLTPTRLTQAYPVLHTWRSRTDLNFEELIRNAWEFRVLRALNAKGIADDDIISTEVLEPLVAVGCLLHAVMQDPSIEPEYVARISADYDRTMESVLSSRHWYEDPQSTNPPPRPNEEQPSPRRAVLGLTR